MKMLATDLRYAIRQLRRAPAFASVAILTLALAIGVSTAVFSVLDATVVRPLPYTDPARIVVLRTFSPQGYTQPASWPQFLDWRREAKATLDLAGVQTGSANLESGRDATAVRTVEGSDNFFDIFGVQPLLGRTFRPGEEGAGKGDVVVLSYELWQQTLGARTDVIGTTLRLDGVPHTIVGVMPAGFRYPVSVVNAIYRPLHPRPQQIAGRGQHWLPTIARLQPGVTLEQASLAMQQVFDNLGRAYPDEVGRKVKLLTLAKAALGKTGAPLRVLTLAVFAVLLVGCVNIAGLLLARGVRRQRELAVRSAVGAGRGRLVRQLLTESAVLSLLGAAVGVLVAAGLLQTLRQLLVHSLARGADVSLNLPVLAATVVVALAVGLVAGVLPAFATLRIAPSMALRSGGSAGTSRAQGRLRGALIVVQVALALGLIVCSGVLLRQLQALRTTELGFSPDHLLTEEVVVTQANYAGRDQRQALFQPLLERVRAIPGVTGAGIINLLPIADWGSNSDIAIVGKPPVAANQEQLAENRVMMEGTMEAIGAHLVRGRLLKAATDHANMPLVTNVNEAFVHRYFNAGEDPVGRQVQWGNTPVTIVGVTSDLRQSLTQPPMPEMDYLAGQLPAEYVNELGTMTLVVRTAGDPARMTEPLRAAMHEVDPLIPFRTPLTMQQVVADQLTFERLESWLFGIFAALTMVLSLVGLYGTVQHEVELRTRDIGVRMALGSSRGLVVRGILSRVAVLMAIGVACGWALTLALERTLASVVALHAIRNAGLLIALTATLALFGILASLPLARRAASIDPMKALRTE